LDRLRLLESITPELAGAPDAIWDSLARLDRYRLLFPTAPPQLTNAILIGSLLVPLGALDRNGSRPREGSPDRVSFGMLPVARRDIERLRHIGQMLPRMTDADLPPRAARALAHRPSFADSLLWLEVFGDSPDLVQHWTQVRSHREPARDAAAPAAAPETGREDHHPPGPRRRRRRRRRGRRRGGQTPIS
jgi:hypothetical protein